MSRTGLLIALALAAVVGGIFAIYPELDLKIASYFVDTKFRPDLAFGLRFHPKVWALRDTIISISGVIAFAAGAALVWKAARPDLKMVIPARAAILLLSTLVIGPGLVTNIILKSHWERPRPIDVTEFGGSGQFIPWWNPVGDCAKNCSFVSGDVSGAYWTLAAAAVVPAPWQPVAFAAALALGAGMSVLRMMAGAHFASDVLFAGVFTFVVVWLGHALLYRWEATRTTDEAIEGLIERSAAYVRSRIGALRKRIFARPESPVSPEVDFG